MTKWHWGVRCGLAIACLFAWRLLTEVPVPGLTNDAVTRQLQDYRLRDISIAYVGVRPLVDVMLLLFMVTSLSQRARRAVGDWGTLPYQVALAAGVLVAAASEGRGLALTVHDSGQLGRASIDPYLVVGGVLAGTALVLAIGWILGQYALCTSPVTGWLILYAADLLDRWQYRWTTAWDRVSPHEWASIWPFAAQAAAIVLDIALVLGVIMAIRVFRLRVPVADRRGRRRLRDERLELHILRASPLFAAALPSVLVLTASDFLAVITRAPLVDPVFSLVLFAVAIPAGLFLERLNFDPGWIASNMNDRGVTVVGVPRGRLTEVFLRRRLCLLAAIAVPSYALSLAAPQMVELLVPSAARVNLYGVQIALVTVILYGAVSELQKQAGVKGADRASGPRERAT